MKILAYLLTLLLLISLASNVYFVHKIDETRRVAMESANHHIDRIACRDTAVMQTIRLHAISPHHAAIMWLDYLDAAQVCMGDSSTPIIEPRP